MLEKVNMPSMGATMEEGTIIAWLVHEGDNVKQGDILLEIETDKSTFDFESPCSGVVRKIIAKEGDVVPVQELVAIIGDADEEIPADWLKKATPVDDSAPVVKQATSTADQAVDMASSAAKMGRVKISPKARKLAVNLGVDIAAITGTGPGGRIESLDITKAAQQAPAQDDIIAFDAIRQKINATVVQSKQQIPHFYVQAMVDMTGAVAYREKHADKGDKISYNALLAKAIVAGIEAEPSLNNGYSEKGLVPRKAIDVGLAIETPRGVVIAVVEGVDRLDASAISKEMLADIEAARNERFDEIKMDGACMTISSLGMYRVEMFIPIIHPGESAILGIGTIAARAVVSQGKVVVRKTMPVTICVDHRIADGAVAARFLEAFAGYLERL